MPAFGRGTGFCDQISQLEQELGHSPALVALCWAGNAFLMLFSGEVPHTEQVSVDHFLILLLNFCLAQARSCQELDNWAVAIQPLNWIQHKCSCGRGCGVCSQQLRSGPSVQLWLFKGLSNPWGAAEGDIPPVLLLVAWSILKPSRCFLFSCGSRLY